MHDTRALSKIAGHPCTSAPSSIGCFLVSWPSQASRPSKRPMRLRHGSTRPRPRRRLAAVRSRVRVERTARTPTRSPSKGSHILFTSVLGGEATVNRAMARATSQMNREAEKPPLRFNCCSEM
ncbi:hypothetical protein GY45DRAFT_62273 [Cubamyces sp. BRFM 1775]|nr:hypothetical protein GY45DRAFT_62273 [Cubamyces sp. BRFM 1775]